MAQEQQQQPQKPDIECKSARGLLSTVTEEIARFESKKLAELRTELDAFVKKQDELVATYKQRFPELRKAWCVEQDQLTTLCNQIKGEFSLEKKEVTDMIKECICTPIHDLCCLGTRIDKRKKCVGGPLDQAVDAAQIVFDDSKRKLLQLMDLVKNIEGDFKKNKDLLDTIPKPGTARVVVMYWFAFKLLPVHKRMTPFDVKDEACKSLCGPWDPNKLCAEVFGVDCKEDPDDKGCGCGSTTTPTSNGTTGWLAKTEKKPCETIVDDGVVLIDPATYGAGLDTAWCEFWKAKEALAEAQAAVKKCQEELKRLEAERKAMIDGLDKAIETCLKNHIKPNDDCCRGNVDPKKGC